MDTGEVVKIIAEVGAVIIGVIGAILGGTGMSKSNKLKSANKTIDERMGIIETRANKIVKDLDKNERWLEKTDLNVKTLEKQINKKIDINNEKIRESMENKIDKLEEKIDEKYDKLEEKIDKLQNAILKSQNKN